MPYAEEMSKSGSVVDFATITECQQGVTVDKAVRPQGLLFIKPASPGSAYVGGDLTGNARGAQAIDVQSFRSSASNVASGANGSCFGGDNQASGSQSTAIGYGNVASQTASTAVGSINLVSGARSGGYGYNNTVSGADAVVVGSSSTATQQYAVAIGYSADATATQANALGYDAAARVTRTTNLSGGIIIKKDSGEIGSDASLPILHAAGTDVVVMSQLVNLLSGGGGFARWTTPSGSSAWLDEVGVIAAKLSGGAVTNAPIVSFGIDGNTTKYLPATELSQLTALRKRHHFLITTGFDAETILRGDVVIGGSGPSTYQGRFYWRVKFVENEP